MNVWLAGNVSKDCAESCEQVRRPFAEILEGRAAAAPDFMLIAQLALFINLMHPIFPTRPGRSFSRKARLYGVTQPLDYATWRDSFWEGRVDHFAQTVSTAIGRVPSTRMLEEERDRLLEEVEYARVALRAASPSELAQPGLIYADIRADSSVAGLGAIPGLEQSDATQVEFKPEQAADIPAFSAPSEVERARFKLYCRIGKRLQYREAWFDGSAVIEHFGASGERGEARAHATENEREAARTMRALAREARAAGFRPIAPSRHASLIVEYRAGGCDLERRHAIEDYLNRLTGWLGLGHCDGGSIGMDTMEVACLVVDFDLAKEAIAQSLAASPYADFTRIYRQQD